MRTKKYTFWLANGQAQTIADVSMISDTAVGGKPTSWMYVFGPDREIKAQFWKEDILHITSGLSGYQTPRKKLVGASHNLEFNVKLTATVKDSPTMQSQKVGRIKRKKDIMDITKGMF